MELISYWHMNFIMLGVLKLIPSVILRSKNERTKGVQRKMSEWEKKPQDKKTKPGTVWMNERSKKLMYDWSPDLVPAKKKYVNLCHRLST